MTSRSDDSRAWSVVDVLAVSFLIFVVAPVVLAFLFLERR